MATALGLGIAICFSASGAESTGTNSVATPERPAVVSVQSQPATGLEASQQRKTMTVDVLGFNPPEKGSVQAIVKVETGTAEGEKEIGRFGLFPNAQFKADTPEDAQRFSFTLDEATAKSVEKAAKVKIDLKPFGGAGTDARLEIGAVDVKP
jgi:hypothetical protein